MYSVSFKKEQSAKIEDSKTENYNLQFLQIEVRGFERTAGFVNQSSLVQSCLYSFAYGVTELGCPRG
jgi:hypothetical protein